MINVRDRYFDERKEKGFYGINCRLINSIHEELKNLPPKNIGCASSIGYSDLHLHTCTIGQTSTNFDFF